MEANGYYNGKEVMVGSLAFLSVLVGALLANWLYQQEQAKDKQSYKADAALSGLTS